MSTVRHTHSSQILHVDQVKWRSGS